MIDQIHCVIHCRVSTGKQAYEGESLGVQERLCREIATRNGWQLAHEPWLEAYSGRKHGREAFSEVLAFLDHNPGVVRFYVFRAIDRFTRGGVLLYARMKQELAQRGVELVDSMGVIQPSRNTLDHVGFEYEWSRISPSEIAEVVMATTAKTEVSTILTRLIGQEIALTQKGYKIRAPQDGYLNERVFVNGKKRTILVPDPERAKFFLAMFELRAAGQLTDYEIVSRINAMGYRRRSFNRWDAGHSRIIGQAGGGPLLVKRLQEIIRRPIYCGVVWEKWTKWQPIEAPYPGLVSLDVWNAANRGARYLRETSDGLELLHDFDRTPPRTVFNRNNPDYPFKNVILCPRCRKPFMGSASRGRSGERFPAYHCSRGHRRVARGKAVFDKAVSTYINSLCIGWPMAGILVQALVQRFHEREAEHEEAVAAMQRTVADLEIEKAEAVRAFKAAGSRSMRDALEADVGRLDAEIAAAAVQRTGLEMTEADLHHYVTEVSEVLEHPAILLESPADTGAQRLRFARVFEEYPTIEEIEAGTAKLTPIFSVLRGQQDPEAALVRLSGLTWNQIEGAIQRWKSQGR
jgi:DNA invertase Pin-like site-specific DNA recombinase